MPTLILDEPGKKVDLSEIDTCPPKHISKDEANKRLDELTEELFELQDAMWGARTRGVLIVLQGRDAAGKDGAIKNVAGAFNPRGINVVSYGVPTTEEREHDFLWRVHKNTPRRGEIAIFNRSHYEDVLVVRVHDLAPKSVWKHRFDQINAFEEMLAESGTIILKFFLHISKGEQEKRLLEREQDPRTAWKLNVGDWKERELWRDFSDAYEDVLSKCATKAAPWHVVPADSKWYRNLVVAEAVRDAMKPYKKEWLDKLAEEGKSKAAELQKFKAERAANKG
ncbi:MAG: PPK2 family polyphosphate kinase [Polyangiaceae bacterium]